MCATVRCRGPRSLDHMLSGHAHVGDQWDLSNPCTGVSQLEVGWEGGLKDNPGFRGPSGRAAAEVVVC